MSFNGSGTFQINTAGQPVATGTVISSTAFNALTADLATGLSTCITKDGQTTPTANIPMGSNKITGLGSGTASTDAATLGQAQSTVAKLLSSVSGADTITAAASPNITSYVAGQMFYFVAAGANTTAVTLNIDSLGAKAVTRDGTTALVAGDITSGEVVVVIYDGTRFQMVSPNTRADVTGPASATDNAIARFDGTTGKLIQNSGVTINDSSQIVGIIGTNGAPSFVNSTSATTGIYFPTATTVGVSTSGSLRLYILSGTAFFWNNCAFGYGTTSGGAVTQATSRTTGVTLDFCSGAITLVSAAGTTAWQSFTVTNAKVAVDDLIVVNQKSGTDLYEIHVTNVAAGSFRLSFRTTGGTTVEQPVFNFAVIKGSVS